MKDIKIKDKTYSLYLSSKQVEMVENEMGMDIMTAVEKCPTSTKFFRLVLQGSLVAKHESLLEDMDIHNFIDEMQQDGWSVEKKIELIVDVLSDAGFMKLPKKVRKQMKAAQGN